MRISAVIMLGIAVTFSASAFSQNISEPTQTAAVTPVASPTSRRVTLLRDTPVSLMAINEVSTAKIAPGTRFKLRVNQPIMIDGVTIIPVGTPATGEVLSTKLSGGLGKSGAMTARLLHINFGDAEIPLEGEKDAKGTGAGSVGIVTIFAGPLGLFHRGNSAKIKAGELLSGFIKEDVTLDLDARPVKRITAVAGQ